MAMYGWPYGLDKNPCYFLMPLLLLLCSVTALLSSTVDGTACAFDIRTLVPILCLNMKGRSGFVIAGGKQYSRQSTLFPLF